MAFGDMRIIVFTAVICHLLEGTRAQETTCDVNTPCNCCKDGGITCERHPGEHCDGPCKDGYYGARCILPCPAECVSCHQSFGQTSECYTCTNGRYGKACTELCSNCVRCHKDTGVCGDCANGYYGQNCTNVCSLTCVDLQCDILSGKCMDCSDGYYGDMCNNKCSYTCQNILCDKTTGVCQRCQNGYYGEYCNKTCNANCLDTCHMITGICSKCIRGRYGKYCDSSCSYSCSGYLCERISGTCTDGCVENFDGDKCEDCVKGKHGTKCDQNCPNCLNDGCDRNNGICTYGCKSGFSDSWLCCVNNTNCGLCTSQSECTQCTIGNYGQKCEHKCPNNCEGPCAKGNGHCGHCKLNYYGSICDNKCSETCFTTDDQISRCRYDNGECEFGCVHGFYGYMCEFSCSVHCNGTCQPESGECNSCKYNRYGKTCKNLCSHACARIGSETACNKTTGSCLYGCAYGFYGNRCDMICSSGCQNHSCERRTGQCTDGCTENFSGLFCLTAMHAYTHTDSNGSSSVVLGVSLGLAVAVLIAGAGVAVVFRKRITSMLKRCELPQTSSTYDDLNTDLRATDADYSCVTYDNTNDDRDNRVYINTVIEKNSERTEPGLYVNMQ